MGERYSTAQRLAAARQIIRSKAAWLSVPLLKLVFREAPGLGTFATSARGVVLYDPAKVTEWAPEVKTGGLSKLDADCLAGVIAHEVCHILFQHFARGPKMAERYKLGMDELNVIGDFTCNEAVKSMGLSLPANAVFAQAYGFPENQTFEEYCRMWADARPPVPPPPGGQGQGDGQGNGQGQGDGQGNRQGQAPAGKPGKGQSPGKGHAPGQAPGGVAAGHCGGCAGHPTPGEADPADPDGRTEADWQGATETAAREYARLGGKHAGMGSGELQRWAEERLRPPRIPWTDKLRRVVRVARNIAAGKDRLDFSHPSPYQAALGYGVGRPIAPRRVSYLPNIAVAVDTSGSMGAEVFGAILSEVDGVLAAIPQKRALFLACDASVNAERKVGSAREAGALLRGGGGTDFRPVFDRLAALPAHERPDVCIFATDGFGPAPAEPPPRMLVIWLIVPGGRVPAPWGEPLTLEREDLE